MRGVALRAIFGEALGRSYLRPSDAKVCISDEACPDAACQVSQIPEDRCSLYEPLMSIVMGNTLSFVMSYPGRPAESFEAAI